MESTVTHRNSGQKSCCLPQQWQSKLCRCLRLLQQSLLKVAKSVQTEHRDSELVRYHGRGAEADAEGINNTIMDALRHRLHLRGISHFCACTHARRSRFNQQAFLLHTHFAKASMRDHSHYVLKHKCSCFWLGLTRFHGRKPIFRGALIFSLFTLLVFFSPVIANPYEKNLSLDIPLSVGAFTLLFVGQYSFQQMEVAENPYSKEDLLPWDRPFAGTWNPTADRVSSVLSVFIAVPFVLAGSAWNNGEITDSDLGTFMIMVVQVAAIENGLNLACRSSEVWPRPFLFGQKGGSARDGPEAQGSFYSGHSSTAFATAVFTSIWFQKMYPNSQWIPWIWGGSLGIASTVAILRVAAGKHFPSDVIAGALVGSAVSYSVLKLHETDRTSLSLSVFPGWVGLYYKF